MLIILSRQITLRLTALNKPYRAIPFFLILFLVLSCTTTIPVSEAVQFLPPPTPPRWGMSEYSSLEILESMDTTLPVGGAAVALNLKSPGIEIILTSADRLGQGETRTARTSEFAQQQGLQLAINGSPYDPVDILNRSNRPADISGLHINEGQIISPGVDSFDALFILENGMIVLGPQSNIPPKTITALGGFKMLLSQGVNLGQTDVRYPRSCVGLSADGQTLYLAVFDGRQKNRAGLTSHEAALWMKWLGCDSALNLDGGGSSTLVLIDWDENVHILNSPVHRGRPGLERAVGNHLGVRLIR